MPFDSELPIKVGPNEVLLSSGETRVIDITEIWRAMSGDILFVKDRDEQWWNWHHFVMVKKINDGEI